MYPMHPGNEADCLQVAVDLLKRSDAYTATDPRLARQYARQAYALGQRSRWLRHSIARERIRMIVQDSNQRRMKKILGAVPLSQSVQLRHGKSVAFIILLLLAGSLLTATPVGELSDQRVTLAARTINAPLYLAHRLGNS